MEALSLDSPEVVEALRALDGTDELDDLIVGVARDEHGPGWSPEHGVEALDLALKVRSALDA